MGGQVVARVVMVANTSILNFIQCPRLELRRAETAGDLVIDLVGGFGARPHLDPEDPSQLVVEPVTHMGAAVGAPVRTQDPERIA